MLKIAHRGYSEIYKDNTLEAFTEAIIHNFDMLELDIQLCKDNKIVIFHDKYLNSKLISDYTLEELEEQDVLSLSKFFNLIDNYKTQIYLDIKGIDLNIVPILIQLLKNTEIVNIKNIYVASFNRKITEELYKSKLRFYIGYITDSNYTNIEWDILIRNVDFISINWEVLDSNTIEYLQHYSKIIFVHTCTNKQVLNEIKKYNIDGIVSNIII